MNMYRVNIIISDIAYYIQEQMKKPENCNIYIPIGNLLWVNLFSGFGPNIKMKVVLLGTVETDLRSEFISKGINFNDGEKEIDLYFSSKIADRVYQLLNLE